MKLISVNVTFDYSFDQQLFDSVSVTQPQEVELNRWVYKDTKNIVVNGKYISSNLARGETVSEAMNDLLIIFKNNLNSHSDGEIDLAYYSDKDCTTAVNFNTMTDEQFLALDTLYVTATLNNDFALEHNRALKNTVIVDKWADGVSEEYKMIFSNFVNEVERNSITVIGNTAATQTISQKDRKVYFDGELFTETQYTLTPGQVFTLRIENLQYESDFNLDDFIMNF